MSGPALLSGPDVAAGMEGFASHQARLGPLPPIGSDFTARLERSGLRGRGGAAFPVASKWRGVAAQPGGRPVVLVNGGEGEPFSHKDRLLMETRPHLIIDGAAIAAGVLRANEIVHYVGAEHTSALHSLRLALQERPDAERRMTRLIAAPVRYISGEESAAVHFVNDGVALPTAIPPRPFERGVGGRPTLVQNVETLAHVALIARYGEQWFGTLGRNGCSGTVLVTLSGAVPRTVVIEVPQGSTIADAVSSAGGLTSEVNAVLLGGYFGGWIDRDQAWSVMLDAATLKSQGRSLGCGVIGLLPADRCGVIAASRVMSYLAHESARQCGPCTFGLRAIAAATGRIAASTSEHDDLERTRRWAGLLTGRGACHHPDGAAGFLQSALLVFRREFEEHHHGRRCTVQGAVAATA